MICLRDISSHAVGYMIFLVIWATLPFFVIREPMTGWKRAAEIQSSSSEE